MASSRRRISAAERQRGVALVIAGTFALHPIQAESVAYAAQRAEVLSALFTLAALVRLDRAARREAEAGGAFGARCALELAREIVSPGMIGAREQPRLAAALRYLGAAMPTHIQECAQFAVASPHDQNGQTGMVVGAEAARRGPVRPPAPAACRCG